jgi:hypothetical protein
MPHTLGLLAAVTSGKKAQMAKTEWHIPHDLIRPCLSLEKFGAV